MSDPNSPNRDATPLNPALRAETERVYPTGESSPPPVDTASAKEGEGEGWPVVWLVVTAICVAIGVYLLT